MLPLALARRIASLAPPDVPVERMQRARAVLDSDDHDPIALPQMRREADRRLLDGGHLVAHARRGVEQDREIERHVRGREERQILLNAVLEHREVLLARPVTNLSAVGDDHIERDEIDAAAEGPGARSRERAGAGVGAPVRSRRAELRRGMKESLGAPRHSTSGKQAPQSQPS